MREYKKTALSGRFKAANRLLKSTPQKDF